MMKAILTSVPNMVGVPDHQYLHGLIFYQDGTLSYSPPHFHFTFKSSKKHDPYTTALSKAMTTIHKKDFKEATNKEIMALKEVNTWNMMVGKHLPEGVNDLSSTWAFKINRYTDGIFFRFKARFCIRGYLQKEGV